MTGDRPTALTSGLVAPGFEGVAVEFERNLRERGDTGAAFAAVVDGTPVIDLWGGLADAASSRPWQHDTLVGIFSGTKGLVAVCLLAQVERGALDLERPVCSYWPEFAAHGKERILVGDVVSHRAGLPGLTTAVSADEAIDHVRMATLLASQPPLRVPDGRLYYHALTFGWLSGELIRRTAGLSVGRFFAQAVAGPLGLDAWIGLPIEHEPRVAVLQAGAGFATQRRNGVAIEARDPIGWSIWGNPPRFSRTALVANTRRWRAGEVPASNGVVSARSLARLYGCLACGGEIDGRRILAPETVLLGATCLAQGIEPYIQEPLAYGVGFELQTEAQPFGPAATAFGHRGSGGSVHGAWPELRTGFSYTPNTLCEPYREDPRPRALLRALHEAVL